MSRSRCLSAAAVFVALSLARVAPTRAGDPGIELPRQLFAEGTERVRNADWAGALASFERSAALKPHAITMYNIGACQRAIGSYTRARVTFARSRKGTHASGPTMKTVVRPSTLARKAAP